MSRKGAWVSRASIWVLVSFILMICTSTLSAVERYSDGENGAVEKVQTIAPAAARKKGFPWLFVAGGVAVAGITVAVILLTKNENEIKKDPDLQMEWLFSGNAKDTSGKGRHGTVHHAQLVPDRKGVANSAYSFDSSDQYIEGPNFVAQKNNQVSVSCWIKLTHDGEFIIMMGNDFALCQFYKEISMDISSVSLTSSAVIHIEYSQWTHITGTYDGSYIRIYKNGVLAATQSHSGNISNPQKNFLIGSFSTLHWPGEIDEVHIYSRVLSDSEILKIYQEEK